MSDRQHRFAPDTFHAARQSSRLGITSIEAWPAAGGGLLVGMAEAGLAGAAPLRTPVKTMFLRLGCGSEIQLILPYVVLDPQTRSCARVLIAHELFILEGSVFVSDAHAGHGFPISDLPSSVELGVRALGAAVRTLLVAAAAEKWNRAERECETIDSTVRSAHRSVRYSDLAVEAALSSLPHQLRLRCGRRIFIA